MERDIKPTYDELESYVENLQKQLADAQATIAALQARVRELELALSQKTMRVLDLIAANERLTHEIVGLRYAKQ